MLMIRFGDPVDVAGERHYPVTLHAGDAGADWLQQPVADMRLPCPLRPPPAGLEVRDALLAEFADVETLVAIGRYLYDLLSGDFAEAWQAAVARLGNGTGDGPVRTFFDIQPAELRALPWELITTADERHLFLDRNQVCLRGSYLPLPPGEVPVPVRLLVVEGNPHDPDLRADDEIDAIVSALRDHPGQWHVEVLHGPTPQQFLDAIRDIRPHVLHFIGHSGTSVSGAPMLELRPAPGKTAELTAYKIRNSLADHSPQVVFLNACRTSGRAGPDGEFREATRSLSRAFEDAGARAVLSVQADLRSAPAVKFTGAFYASLASGEPVDVAVRCGRAALFDVEDEPRTWALPCLTVRTAPDEVLPIRLGIPRDAVSRLVGQRYYRDVARMVDRKSEHRTIGQRIESLPDDRRALFLTGDKEVGKSWLIRSWLLTRHLRGEQVTYVDLADQGRMSWLDVLRNVGKGLTACLPERAAGPHREFAHQIVHLRQGQDPPEAPAADLLPDDNGPWQAGTEEEPKLRADAFAAALRMLRATAGELPLLVVIDHLAAAMLPDDVRDKLEPGLLLPIAQGRAGKVAVVLVHTRSDDLFSPDLQEHAQLITVQPFERSMRLFRDYAVMTSNPFDGTWQQMAQAMIDRPFDLMPQAFSLLEKMVLLGAKR